MLSLAVCYMHGSPPIPGRVSVCFLWTGASFREPTSSGGTSFDALQVALFDKMESVLSFSEHIANSTDDVAIITMITIAVSITITITFLNRIVYYFSEHIVQKRKQSVRIPARRGKLYMQVLARTCGTFLIELYITSASTSPTPPTSVAIAQSRAK